MLLLDCYEYVYCTSPVILLFSLLSLKPVKIVRIYMIESLQLKAI